MLRDRRWDPKWTKRNRKTSNQNLLGSDGATDFTRTDTLVASWCQKHLEMWLYSSTTENVRPAVPSWFVTKSFQCPIDEINCVSDTVNSLWTVATYFIRDNGSMWRTNPCWYRQEHVLKLYRAHTVLLLVFTSCLSSSGDLSDVQRSVF